MFSATHRLPRRCPSQPSPPTAKPRSSKHTCRGNFRSTFVASRGYEPVAGMVFKQIDVDGFMEWCKGGFAPLRLLPKGKRAVLGFVAAKVGSLEKVDDIKRRIDAASRCAPLDQLCLSPQLSCSF
jgi:5-methyltetrahydropteroyltriglutamate--homocysteine methyltransferase